MENFYSKLQATSPVAVIIISIALMLICGFLMTRLTKLLKLPNVTAYILTGILLGPYCFNMIPSYVSDGMEFISDIALAFIAFNTGEFFRLSSLKKNGAKTIVITLTESLLASLLIFILTYYVLRLQLAFSVVLAALAAATAPASTVMTIRQTGAKGDFVDTLLQVVALDDIVGLIAYSVAISIATASMSGEAFNLFSVVKPLLINLGVLVLGGMFGFLLKFMMPKKRSNDNRLIISIAMLFAFCGICAVLDISPLLGCMSMGTVYINITDDDKLFKQLNYFSPPILLLFFVRSGVTFKLDALWDASTAVGSTPLIVVGILYFIVRIIGKYFGAFIGCVITKKSKEVRNNLGFALIPQAGVAIGLAVLGARAIGGEMGSALNTIILASSVLYELVGPVCAKFALFCSGSYSNKLEELVDVEEKNADGQSKTAVELLIERINAIQLKIKAQNASLPEEEQAFNEAAEEQYAMNSMSARRTGHRSNFK